MEEFSVSGSQPNFAMKRWRGERMCLVACDVDAPEPDLAGSQKIKDRRLFAS